MNVPPSICRRRSREGREQHQSVLLEAHLLREVQGALLFESLPIPLTEDKMLTLDG